MSEIEPTQALTQMDRETAFAAIDAAVELLTATMHPDARRLRDAGAVLRAMVGRDDALTVALKCATGHIEHMAAWISKTQVGTSPRGIYSFESLGEDMPSIIAALKEQPR